MMTIKEFASLCGCNTQTLRYYDKIDLLKPVKVDPWSGYRYYTKSQAIDFVKIKNLQAADFTIEEVKALLTIPDTQVYEAFDRKIAQQSRKLERIREIQQSYLTEVNTMKKLINSFCDYLLEKAEEPEMIREFCLEPSNAVQMVETLRSFMMPLADPNEQNDNSVNLIMNGSTYEGEEAVENITSLLREEKLRGDIRLNAEPIPEEDHQPTDDMETVWQLHGWTYAHEVLSQIPELETGKGYIMLLKLHQKHNGENLSYPLLFIGSMLMKDYGGKVELNCNIEQSEDGKNHFFLLRKP